MTTGTLLLSLWDPGPVVPVACVSAIAGYTAYFRRQLGPRAALFALGVAIFFLALSSPIGVLARGYLFSAHMLQHLLLTLAVPPLLLLGTPRDHAAAEPSGTTWIPRRALWHWVAGVSGMWIWHLRSLCDLAAVSAPMQAFQTMTLIAMGLAFWQPIVGPTLRDRIPPLGAVLYLFAACVACTVLGIVITLSPVEVCPAYAHPVDALRVLPLLRDGWGISCAADQQIGGLLMWVPACLVYASAILATLGRYYREEHPAHASLGEAS